MLSSLPCFCSFYLLISCVASWKSDDEDCEAECVGERARSVNDVESFSEGDESERDSRSFIEVISRVL